MTSLRHQTQRDTALSALVPACMLPLPGRIASAWPGSSITTKVTLLGGGNGDQ